MNEYHLKKYRRFACFKAVYFCDKLPRKAELELYKQNKIIENAQKTIIKLLKKHDKNKIKSSLIKYTGKSK